MTSPLFSSHKLKMSLPQHMIREITSPKAISIKNSPYLFSPKEIKSPFSEIKLFSAFSSEKTEIHRKNDEIDEILALKNGEDVICELFSSAIKLKHLWIFEEKNVINENIMLFILNFLKEKLEKKNKSVFLSQIVLLRFSKNSNSFEYKFFANKDKKIPGNYTNYNYFLYVLLINNHWALASIDIMRRNCTIYAFCQHKAENLKHILDKIHKNFLNFTINEYILNDFFIKYNEKDDNNINCSLFLNYFLIYLYVNNSIISENSQINPQILKENQEKIVKILHAYIKKSMIKSPLIVNPIDKTKKNSIFPMKIDKNEAVSALKKLNNFKRISQSNVNLQESQRKKSIMKKSKFLNDHNHSFFPKLTSNSNNLSKNQEKVQKTVILTKEDLIPFMKDAKKKIIDEILEKIEEKKEKESYFSKKFTNNNNRVENFNNYQNYLYYSYFNNPLMYDQLLNDYNSRYYSHLLKSFGISDKEYEQSMSSQKN